MSPEQTPLGMAQRLAGALYEIRRLKNPFFPKVLFGEDLSFDQIRQRIKDGTLEAAVLQPFVEDAVACLQTMLDPTDGMLADAVTPCRHGNTVEFDDLFEKTVAGYWEAMILAALAGK